MRPATPSLRSTRTRSSRKRSLGVARPGRSRRRPEVPGRLAPRRPPCRRAFPPGNRRSRPGRRTSRGARRASRPPPAELGGPDLRQVGMRQRMGGELPAVRRSEAGPVLRQPPRPLVFRTSRSSTPAQPWLCEDRCRRRELAVVAVVERDARAGGSGKLQAEAPVLVASWSVTPWKPWRSSQPIWRPKSVAGHVELRKPGIRRRVGDHVVHEDRDRVDCRMERSWGAAEDGG